MIFSKMFSSQVRFCFSSAFWVEDFVHRQILGTKVVVAAAVVGICVCRCNGRSNEVFVMRLLNFMGFIFDARQVN